MIVLDTHVWVWYLNNSDQTSEEASASIERAKEEKKIYISCISTWEILILEKKNRLKFTTSASLWIRKSENLSFLEFVPINNTIVELSTTLPGKLHQDPADRLILATAHYLGFPLITKDKKLRDYPHIKTIW